MERYTLRVSLPLLWTGCSTKTFYKTFEGPNNYPQETQYQINNLLRRFSDSWKNSARSYNEQGYFNLPFPTSQLCDTHKDGYSATYKEAGTFRNVNGICRDVEMWRIIGPAKLHRFPNDVRSF